MPSMLSYPRRLQSGQITCYLNRTYHVLTTSNGEGVDIVRAKTYRCGRPAKGRAKGFGPSRPRGLLNRRHPRNPIELSRRDVSVVVCIFGVLPRHVSWGRDCTEIRRHLTAS